MVMSYLSRRTSAGITRALDAAGVTAPLSPTQEHVIAEIEARCGTEALRCPEPGCRYVTFSAPAAASHQRHHIGCPDCDYSATWMPALVRHRLEHHPAPPVTEAEAFRGFEGE